VCTGFVKAKRKGVGKTDEGRNQTATERYGETVGIRTSIAEKIHGRDQKTEEGREKKKRRKLRGVNSVLE